MDGHTSHQFTQIWSQVPPAHWSLQGILSHVHDISLSALAAAIILLGVVILLELRAVARLRHVTDRSLERVFEQLDLLRFETQALLEQRQSPVAQARFGAAPTAAVVPVVAAAPPAVSSVSAATLIPAPSPPIHARAAVAQPPLPTVGADQPLAGALRIAAQPAPAQLAHAEPVAGALTARNGLSAGEARLLSSLAEARARRAAAVEPARA